MAMTTDHTVRDTQETSRPHHHALCPGRWSSINATLYPTATAQFFSLFLALPPSSSPPRSRSLMPRPVVFFLCLAFVNLKPPRPGFFFHLAHPLTLFQ